MSNPSGSAPSCSSTTTTLSFVEHYLQGDFPTDGPPDQPSDLCFAPNNSAPQATEDQETHASLQSVATSVKDFFREHGFLPALKTISGALENDRTLAIKRFNLDDPKMWPVIDRCARIANALFKAPILVTLIHADTQFVLAAVDCAYKPREPLIYQQSLCSHTALRTDGSMLEIVPQPDTQADWRFKHIPAPSFAREDGGPAVPVGSLCVLGNSPRPPMTPAERGALVDLSHLLSTEIQRVFQETRERKETLRRNFVSGLITDLSSFHSTISPPVVAPPVGSTARKAPNPESEFRMLSATSDVRRMLDSDFACLVDLSSLHPSWAATAPDRKTVARTVSRSKHGWIGHQRGKSFPPSSPGGTSQASTAPGLRVIDYSCSDRCENYSPEAVFGASRAMHPLIAFLRTYTETSTSGYAHIGCDGVLQCLLPRDSQAHIAIPLFNNAQPALLLLVSSKTSLCVYEPADVSFASTFAVLCLGSLAKIKLIKADAAKTTFFSTISHEMRTPLHGLLSQLELIREFAPKEFIAETDTFLQTAEVCGITLRDVLNDVLDFGKQEHGGESQVRCTEADLSVLAIEVMSVAYGRRRQWESVTGESESAVQVHVAIEDSSTGWGALVDVGGLRRVLLNLASNALKYTPKGSIVLSLRELELETPTLEPSDGRRLIEFSMMDTGIGMSSEYKDDIFTPFSQESIFNPGSGLGMSISEAILSKLGGEITISSELGKGTTVTFTLLVEFFQLRPVSTAGDAPRTVRRTLISQDAGAPFERAGSAPSPPPDTPPCLHTPTQPVWRPDSCAAPPEPSPSLPVKPPMDVRVLVVDDNAIGRKILTTLLMRKGVPFREASDGLEALTVYREFLPNLVWTDVSMPVMDGIESARQMRIIENELEIRPPAHIVALTGLSSHGEMNEGLLGEAALDEWLVKGQANLKTLTSCLEKVQRAVRRRRGSSVSSAASSGAPTAA
ncbi:hypothetical protein B0H17DRAFT_1091127 [Mycena rosella]|uniref:histidine kinase n=1 Tax=Mycena rosella TaxID=1033263 RepID=A0AAD7G4E0_MYCRO|nr:hypothetical protein B0H17DRAFT_1091127 [Mycena rosella]